MSNVNVDAPAAEPAWLALARLEIGVAEVSGKPDNERILGYYRDAGHGEVAHDSVAWCAAFASAMLERAGVGSPKTLLARDFLDWGQSLDTPRAGCIAVLSRGTAASGEGHVGFYAGKAADRLLVLGGNQGDAVSVASFPKNRLLGFRWPSSAATSGTTALKRPLPSGADTADIFDRALAHVLTQEGGWTDDPFDPGGPTNKGITLAELCRYENVELTSDNAAEMRARLRAVDAKVIADLYRSRYWQPACCPLMPPAIALLHFDTAVNQGVGSADRFLQEALSVDADGEIGPITLAASASADPRPLIDKYCELRRAHYRSLSHFWRFGRGWLNRVDATRTAALAVLASPSAPQTSLSKKKEPHPMPDTQQPTADAPVKWFGHSMTIWGVVVTMLTTVLPMVARACGIDLPTQLVQDLGTQLTAVVQAIGGLAGVAITIFGRMRATQPLVLTPPAETAPALRVRDWRRE